jgi:anti-sigma-K factor RskA
MLDHEGSHSEYFEELCALAAGGQISEPELVELQDHMQECAPCRSAYCDFSDLIHNKLILAEPELVHSSGHRGIFSRSTAQKQRFLTRARKQGMLFSQDVAATFLWKGLRNWFLPLLTYKRVSAVAMGILLVTLGVLGYSLLQSNVRNKKLSDDLAALSRQVIQANRSEAAPEPVQSSEPGLSLGIAPVSPDAASSGTDLELAKARREYAVAEARAKELQEQLQATTSELQASRAQLEEATAGRSQFASKLAEAEQAYTRVSNELQGIRQGRSEDSATMAAQRLQIRELSEKLAAQTEDLDRERTLLAAGRDIHDLMGARNLHIVDVLDVDSRGKDQQAFGRVFYTEGKSLIFYAFDLGDRTAARRNASFQVWGTRGPAQSAAESLGIFYVDDQKQNRWVLKFEDPRILAEIDSVFVTVEPPGGSAKPTGHKFLYAYLKADPNHP